MSSSHESNWDRLGEFITRIMAERRVPGIAVGISHKGDEATAGFGVTNIDHPLPVTDETLFQIGSITKTFTGTAIMRLVEMGKLDLDATVQTYVPDFKVSDKEASSQATVRHLLTHMGGWEGDVFDDTGAGDDALAKYVTKMADLQQLAPVGTVFSYNNAGFSLAGYVIEVVTGTSFEAAMKELVFEPLDLKNSYFDPADVMTHRFSVGHSVTRRGPRVARPWPLARSAYAAGGITCSVKDLLRYARFHLGDGGVGDKTRLLSTESIVQMQSPQVTGWRNEARGLAWALDEIDGVRQVSHGGGTLGQLSLLTLVPEHDFAIAIFTNADRVRPLTPDITRYALKEYLGLAITDPTPIESSEEELVPYVGCYSRPFADIEVGMLGGKLVAQMTYKGSFPTKDLPPLPSPPPMTLALCGQDRLLVMDGPMKDAMGDILRNPDGSIGWLRFSTRLHVREE